MPDGKKIINKFLNDRLHITIKDCIKLLTLNGYVLHKQGGSHQTFHKKGAIPVTVVIPKNSKFINSAYVKLIIKHLKIGE